MREPHLAWSRLKETVPAGVAVKSLIGMETSPNEIVPEPSACGGIVLGTIPRGPVSCANVLTAQYFVVWLRRAALLVVVAALAAGCAGGPAEPGPVTTAFKHAKILGPSAPVPGLLREFEKRPARVRAHAASVPGKSPGPQHSR